MKIDFVKMEEKFNAEVYGRRVNYFELPKELWEKIQEEAAKQPFPCYATINEELIVVPAGKGTISPVVLFNAVIGERGDEYFAYVYNTGRGALTTYSACTELKFVPGEIYLWNKYHL